MRELSINGVTFNADYWATRTREEFVKVNSQFWPDLGEQEKKLLLIRIWPYFKADDSDRNETQAAGPEHPGGNGGGGRNDG